MSRMLLTTQRRESKARPFGLIREIEETGMFFQGRDDVHQTFRRTVKRLEKVGIAYALVGAMALNAHRYRRATTDVDILLSARGFDEFRKRFVGKYYDPVAKRRCRFLDRRNGVAIDILVTGRFPGTGK